MMKKKWNRPSILILALSLLLTGNTELTFSAQEEIPAAQADKIITLKNSTLKESKTAHNPIIIMGGAEGDGKPQETDQNLNAESTLTDKSLNADSALTNKSLDIDSAPTDKNLNTDNIPTDKNLDTDSIPTDKNLDTDSTSLKNNTKESRTLTEQKQAGNNTFLSDSEPDATETPTPTPAPSEKPYESISCVGFEDYTASSLTLSWFSDGNNDGFYIYRKSKYDAAYQKLGTVANIPFETHTFKDTKFKRGITFTYKIAAYRYDSNGNPKEGISASEKINIGIPKTVLSSAKRTNKTVTLKWKKVSKVNGYEIYQKINGGSYKKVKTINNGGKLSCKLINITTPKKISFRVRAFLKYKGNMVFGPYGTAKSVRSIASQNLARQFKKLQKQFPNGRYWNHVGKKNYDSSTITKRPCHHASYDDLSTCNHYNCPNGVIGYQCYGFAWKMSDLLYGRSAKIKNFTSFAKCKAGDVIRYSGHSVIIVEKHKNYIIAGECNYGNTCIIKWGRNIPKSELRGALYSRRYH